MAGWTTPRTWGASETPTSANFNAHIRDNLTALNGFVRKTASESVVGSTTLQDDNDLFYSIVDTGRFVIDVYLVAATAADASGDIKIGFTFPTGSIQVTGRGPDIGLASGAVQSGNWAVSAVTGTSSGALSYGCSTTPVGIHLNALYTASTTGTFQVQWAQNSAAGTTTVSSGYMTIRQVA